MKKVVFSAILSLFLISFSFSQNAGAPIHQASYVGVQDGKIVRVDVWPSEKPHVDHCAIWVGESTYEGEIRYANNKSQGSFSSNSIIFELSGVRNGNAYELEIKGGSIDAKVYYPKNSAEYVRGIYKDETNNAKLVCGYSDTEFYGYKELGVLSDFVCSIDLNGKRLLGYACSNHEPHLFIFQNERNGELIKLRYNKTKSQFSLRYEGITYVFTYDSGRTDSQNSNFVVPTGRFYFEARESGGSCEIKKLSDENYTLDISFDSDVEECEQNIKIHFTNRENEFQVNSTEGLFLQGVSLVHEFESEYLTLYGVFEEGIRINVRSDF